MDSKMTLKWYQNGPNRDPKVSGKETQPCTKMTLLVTNLDPKRTPALHQNDPPGQSIEYGAESIESEVLGIE